MAADAPTVFEVAASKLSNPDTPAAFKAFRINGRELLALNTTLADLITFAYGVHTRQVSGGPSWMENDKFDVTGRPQAEGVPNQEQFRGMIKNLLADRFKLAVHTEKKDLPAYVLTVDNRGHRLTTNNGDPNGLPTLNLKGLGTLFVVNANMGHVANALQSWVFDRPVIDRTGLPGRFDFTLTWTPDESQGRSFGPRQPAPTTPDSKAPPGFFTAIQEQLGLRIESQTAPVDVIVIDRVDKPSDN